MKKIITLFFILNAAFCFSQQKQDSILIDFEVQAEFPGGVQEMNKFIAKNLIFPNKQMRDSLDYVNCKSWVKFTVDEEGEIKNAVILKGCTDCYYCDNEVLRVIRMMPKWTPAKTLNKTVKTYITLPVTFKNM